MASKTRTTKSAKAVEETTEVAEQTPKQAINEGIDRVLAESGVGVQHARYKAMRAIAFQAFTEAIDAGDFDGLVDRAIANVDNLPSGWELEKPEAAEKPAPKAKATAAKAPAKTAAKKAPAKTAAKSTTAARKRPSR